MTRDVGFRSPAWRRAWLLCFHAVLTVLVCGGLCTAALIVHAPVPVVPGLVLVCIGGPMLAALELPGAIAVLRGVPRPMDTQALNELRRTLDRLPETQHPLGL